MIYGTKQYKNGKIVGYLTFDSGKTVFLNPKENLDFKQKVRFWELDAIERKSGLVTAEMVKNLNRKILKANKKSNAKRTKIYDRSF